MGAPTGTVAPMGTRILRSTPGLNASTSMLTFSVSISARASPLATGSPSCLSQERILPSSIVSLSLGMTTVCIVRLPQGVLARAGARCHAARHDGLHGGDHVSFGRQSGAL